MTSIDRLSVRLQDARRLLEIHETATGPGAGRRRNFDVLNRSAMLLTIAAWEGFCEDVVSESSARISRRLKRKNLLPNSVIKPFMFWFYDESQLSKPSDGAKNAMWDIAGDGWRAEYRKYSNKKVDDLNTPSYIRLKKLISQTVGVDDIGYNWHIGRYDKSFYMERLSYFLNIRHEIAHGTRGEANVGKETAKNAIRLVERLAHWVAAAIEANEVALDLSATELS